MYIKSGRTQRDIIDSATVFSPYFPRGFAVRSFHYCHISASHTVHPRSTVKWGIRPSFGGSMSNVHLSYLDAVLSAFLCTLAVLRPALEIPPDALFILFTHVTLQSAKPSWYACGNVMEISFGILHRWSFCRETIGEDRYSLFRSPIWTNICKNAFSYLSKEWMKLIKIFFENTVAEQISFNTLKSDRHP